VSPRTVEVEWRTRRERIDPKLDALGWRRVKEGPKKLGGPFRTEVPVEYLRGASIPVPPIAEQRRIVNRVEALLAEVNHVKGRLDKMRAILKRFRQSTLAATCSGKLTEDWRASRNLPEWRTASVADVCSTVVDCPHSTPKWTAEGVTCLRTTNVLVGGLDLREVRFVSEESFKERTSCLEPAPGDVVYSREGGILRIACVIPPGLRTCLGQRMMQMRPNPEIALAPYLAQVLNSPATTEAVRELTGGTAAPHPNVGDIKRFQVPLPAIEEQHEVVRRSEQLFAIIQLTETRLAATGARAEWLPQAILSKAHSGELVQTEAELARTEGRDCESAAALLARIKAVASHTAPSKGRSSRSGKRLGIDP
jgi:type I restriction enzyme, S subunit